MAENSIDVKAGRLFPFHFMILGGIFLFAGLIVVIDHPIIASVLFMLGLLILTAYEGTEIKPSSKTLREYNSFLFFKSGKERKYIRIEGLSIHKAKVSQKMFTPRTMNSSTFTHVEFNAYLKLYEGDKIFLLSDKNKLKLLEKANEIARMLNTSVSDHTLGR